MKKIFCFVLTFLVFCSLIGCKKDRDLNQSISVPKTLYVADTAHILSEDDRIYLDGLCKELATRTTKQFKILTISYVLDKKFGEAPLTEMEADKFMKDTFYQSELTENDALFVISPKDRVVGIYLGKDFEKSLSAEKKNSIVENVAIKNFMENKYSEGILASTKEIFSIVDAEMKFPDKEEFVRTHKPERELFEESRKMDYVFAGIVSIILGMFIPFKSFGILACISVYCFCASLWLNQFVLYPWLPGFCVIILIGLAIPVLYRYIRSRIKTEEIYKK